MDWKTEQRLWRSVWGVLVTWMLWWVRPWGSGLGYGDERGPLARWVTFVVALALAGVLSWRAFQTRGRQ
jgi:hypothetical protein